MKLYGYVGPDEIANRIGDQPPGRALRSAADARGWVGEQDEGPAVIATFIVDLSGTLRVAPRRTEHLACAGGQPVQAAGEITLDASGDTVVATEVSNQSTGYCPEPACWPAVAAALDAAGIARPGNGFTTVVEFRRCESCGQRAIVKDGDFTCAVCGAELPAEWNFE